MSPRLVTYAHDTASVDLALQAGSDHLIIDDPRISLRSWAPEPATTGWDHLAILAEHARSQRADVRLSLNADKLFHDQHLGALEAALTTVGPHVDAIRLQDGGLRSWVAERYDGAIELATEMGNACQASVTAWANEGFAYQVLTNDWPADDARALLDAVPIQAEMLVHGPVLLQLSDRRQLSAYTHPDGDPDALPATAWQTVVIDGRPYPFADNQHGTVMYNTFDRSLYPFGDRLWDLGLSGWLIDGRGQPESYLTTALAAFAHLRQSQRDGTPWQRDDADGQALAASGERPFKPGFFLANNTDHCFDDVVIDHDGHDDLAEVIDVIRNRVLTLIARQPFDLNATDLWLETPDGRSTTIDLTKLTDHHGKPVTSVQADDMVQLPWCKGAVPASVLRRRAH